MTKFSVLYLLVLYLCTIYGMFVACEANICGVEVLNKPKKKTIKFYSARGLGLEL